MEFKRCARCGCFFVSNSNVCCNCEIQDKKDIAKLSNFIDNTPTINSKQELSYGSGVSLNNINRFIENNTIQNIDF